MADVIITNASGVTFTFESGEVDLVRASVDEEIDQTGLPAPGPSEDFLFDFEGVRKIIQVNGGLYLTATTRTSTGTTKTILAQKQWLEQNLNGSQTSANFTSTYEAQTFDGSSYVATKIMWGTITFAEVSGDPELLPFTITLVVGI